MSLFVADASTTLSWLFEDEVSLYADSVFEALPRHGAIAPAVWPLEVANALLMAERRGRTTAEQTRDMLADIEALTIRITSGATAFGGALPLAREYRLTVYDACICIWRFSRVSLLPRATSASGRPPRRRE